MRKMDEMEMSINLKAIKFSWFFTVIALFAWSVFDFAKTGKVTLALMLLILQNLVYLVASNILKAKAGDDEGKKSLILSGILSIFFLLVFGILLYFFHG